jgi:hypothetical protein
MELRGRDALRFMRGVSVLFVLRDMVVLVVIKFGLAFDFPDRLRWCRVRSDVYKIKISTA